MPNFKALDKDSNPIEFAATGTGIASAPFVPHHRVVASALPDGAASAILQEELQQAIGENGEPAATSDVATSGLNGLLKRLLQRLTSLLSVLPSTLSPTGRFRVESIILSSTDAEIVTASALTTPGSTPPQSMAGYNMATYQVVVSGIGTNVVVRIEGSVNGSGFFNLSPTNADTIITSNGNYGFSFGGKLSAIRFTLVAVNGGSPNVSSFLLRGN